MANLQQNPYPRLALGLYVFAGIALAATAGLGGRGLGILIFAYLLVGALIAAVLAVSHRERGRSGGD